MQCAAGAAAAVAGALTGIVRRAGRIAATVWRCPDFGHVLVLRLVWSGPRLELSAGGGMVGVVVGRRRRGVVRWRVVVVRVSVVSLLLLMVIVQKLEVLLLLQLVHHQLGFELRMARRCRCRRWA